MLRLNEHLQELADAATRDGATPGPDHAIRRGRRRRRRLIGGVASVLAVALVAGAAGSGRVLDQPAPTPEVPAATRPTSEVPAAPRPKPATLTPLPDLKVLYDRPRPGSVEARAFHLLASELRRCPGGSSIPADLIGYVWSKRYRRVVMVAARQPPPGETRFCWTTGSGGTDNDFGMFGARRAASVGAPLTFVGSIETGFAEIQGRVTKEAERVRLQFRDGRPPMDLLVLEAGDRYPVNFYVGLFPQGPTSAKQGGWAASTLTALDATGRTVARCRVGPPGDGIPKCPGN
jgi:hypothetical protein